MPRKQRLRTTSGHIGSKDLRGQRRYDALWEREGLETLIISLGNAAEEDQRPGNEEERKGYPILYFDYIKKKKWAILGGHLQHLNKNIWGLPLSATLLMYN